MKSSSATKFRKKYIFFDQLRVLDTTTKPTDDSIELSDHEGNLEEIEAVAEENINKMSCKGKPKKWHSDEDLLEVLKKNIINKRQKNVWIMKTKTDYFYYPYVKIYNLYRII